MTEEKLTGASLFSRSQELLGEDPLEEIFALNLGDFISENLISEDLAEKIGSKMKDKNISLKNQLSEMINIYSSDKTLKALTFSTKDDYLVYKSISKTIKDMLECDAVHIYLKKEYAKGLKNQENNDLILAGTSIELEKDFNKSLGYMTSEENFITDSFKSAKIVEQEINPELNFPRKPELSEEKAKKIIVIPMHNNVKAVGVILVENYNDTEVDKMYLNLVNSIGKLFTTSMCFQELSEEIDTAVESELTQTSELQHYRTILTSLIGDLGFQQQEFVENLAGAVDVKGQYKVAHSKLTAELSRKICKQLGLNEKTTDLIYYAGLLQNIGKITLPEELFTKSGKLSPEEWEKIQEYPNIGVSLLMNIYFLSEVIPYIHYHKELWDGTGKPEGLKGMSIPLGSRIIAVADAFTALTSDRAYRSALDNHRALEIMLKEVGTKWDEVVIGSLAEVLQTQSF